MKRIVGVITMAAASLLVATAGWVAPAAAEIPDVPGWQLSWHDEFDGTGLNSTNWEALYRENSYNNEKQFYLPSQVAVTNGHLQITATNQPYGSKQYRSGLITSRDLYGTGRFEARIDLPTTQGMWPAFWLNPNNVQWPTGGEIDILENRGSQPYLTSSAYHWQTYPGPCCDQHQYVYDEYTATEGGQPVDFHAGYHTYAVEWEETQLRYYVDDNLYFVVNETANRPIFETPKNIIINLAIGGDFGGDPDGSTIFPQEMLVDYVRIWQPQAGLAGDYNGDGTVDAADYTVWRDSDGETGIGLPADGSGNGTVDHADYEIWKSAFGSSTAAATTSTIVPEPGAAIPLGIGSVAVYMWIVAGSCRPDRSAIPWPCPAGPDGQKVW